MSNSIHHAFGLDFGDLSIKLVELRRKIVFGKTIKVALANFGSIPLPTGIISDGKIKDKKKLVLIISKLLKNLPRQLKSRGVVANLPDSETFLTTVEVPDGSSDLDEMVLRAVEKNIPLPPSKIYYDWRVLGRDKKKAKILVGAANQDAVDNYTEILEGAGLTPVALEIESLANLRALTSIQSPPAGSLVVLDLGGSRSGLVIFDSGAPQLSIALPISGNSITETIATALKVNFLEAEKIKVRCGFDIGKCDLELKSIVNKLITDLVIKIKASLRFYEDKKGSPFKPAELVLCGGGANLTKIDKVLADKLKLRVRVGNPFQNLVTTDSIRARVGLEYATAIGLALLPIFMFQNNKSN